MPRPVIDNDLDEIGPSLDELKTALRRKLDRMQPDERETALRQLEGDPNFSGVVDEYRYPTPGAWTEEAFKPTAPAPRKPSFWQRVSPFPIRPESQLGRAGITTLPEAAKALWRKQQREAEIEATTPAPKWLQWAPKARKEGPVMWSDITFPSWMAAGVIPALAGVTGPGKMGKMPKKVVPTGKRGAVGPLGKGEVPFKNGDRVLITPQGETKPIPATVDQAYFSPFFNKMGYEVTLDDGRKLSSGYTIQRIPEGKPVGEVIPTPSIKPPSEKLLNLGTGSPESDALLARYRELKASGRPMTANEEKGLAIYEAQAKADPLKWKVGDGVGWKVAHQTNRGFRIIGIDPESKMAKIRSVADTGLTITGGAEDKIPDRWVHVADLVRDNRYNVTIKPPVTPAAAKEPWQMTRKEITQQTTAKLIDEAEPQHMPTFDISDWAPSEIKEAEALGNSYVHSPERGKTYIKFTTYIRTSEARRQLAEISAFDDVFHKQVIRQALSEGKPVPPEVLAEYPDLAAKAEARAKVAPEAVAPPIARQNLGRLEKGDIIEFKPGGGSYEIVGAKGRQVELRDIAGKSLTISSDTPVIRIAGSWREAQDLAIQRYLPPERPPRALGPELVAPGVAKEPWQMKIGKTRTKEGITAEAEVDWSGKKIIWFRDEESMANPSIVNHEVAHIVIEDLPDAQLERLLDDYAKLKAPGWKAEGYEAEWIVKNKFHQEEIAIDYGQYLTDASQLKPEIKAFFDKELPSSEVLAKYPELAVKGKPLVTEIPKIEAVSFQEGVDNLHRVATDEVVSPQLRLEQPVGARLWPSEEQDIGKLIRKPPPPPTGLPSELPGAKYPGPPTRLPGIPEKKPPPPPTGLPERLPGAKYPGPPTGLPPIPPGYFESFASTYGPKPKYTPPIETLIARGKEFTGDEVGFQYAMRGAQEAAPKMGAVGAKVNWLRAIADPVRRLNPDVRIAWQAASAYSREQAERVQELLVGISGALEQAFGKDTLVSGARPFRDLYRGKPSEALKPIIGSVRDVLERPSEYKNLTSLQRRTAKEWEVITNAELGFSQRMGVDIGEVEGIWMGHWFKDPEKARQAFSKRGLVSPAFKKREHTLEEFGQIAQDFKLEMEDDVLKIAARRLNGTAKARTNQIFLKSVAAKLGGYPLKPGAKTPIGYQAIQSGGKFWVFPENVADDVGRILRPLAEPADEAMVGQAIDAARNVLLNLDFSIGGARQGLLGFVGNPLGAVKAYQEAWQVLRQPEGMAIHLAMNAPEYELAARHGLVLNMSPLDISIGLKGMPKPWLDKVPVMGAWNNFQFNTLMRPLKLAVWKGNYATLKSVRDGKGLSGVAQRFPILGQAVKKFGGRIFKMTDDELMDAAAEAANNWVGGIDWSRIMPGERPSTMRRAILLTEGWTRANVGAFVNLPKLSAQGLMARRLLMQELVILIGVTTAVNVASTGDLPTFDPRSMDFGVINVGPFKIRIIPHGSYVRAFARMIGGEPEKGWARNKSEVKERIDAVWNLVEGRFGQPIRVVTDLARGKDYYGRDIDNKALYMARQGMPIVAQTVLEDMKRDTGVTLAERSVTEFIGFTTYGKPGSQRLLEMAQRKGVMLGIESWDDLQPWQQAQIQMMPEARDIMRRNMSQDTLKRWNIRWNAYDMQLKRDAEFKAGKIKGSNWKDAYYQAQSVLAAQLNQFDEDFKRMRYNPETPEDKALSGYYDTMDKAKSETGVFDGDKWEELRATYMTSLAPELQKYVEDNIGNYDTPQAQNFRRVREILEPYWNLEAQVWSQYGAQAETLKDLATRLDVMATTDERKAKQFMLENPQLVSRIFTAQKQIANLKLAWKVKHLDEAALLKKFYTY